MPLHGIARSFFLWWWNWLSSDHINSF